MKKILIANRSEIATRIIRACHELGLTAVAIYAKEDALSDHRFEADEAYQVGAGDQPVAAYLDMDDIIRVAKAHDVDAIHPGYGFLSENAAFARKCADAGITFIGPKPEQLDMFGDKVTAKQVATDAGVSTIPGTKEPVASYQEAAEFGATHGFPIMLKAAMGGGGRGMRVVDKPEDLKEAFERASSEATQAFGSGEIYLEKLLTHPKHVEVQVIADQHGHTMHLFERDCSVQRRNQKMIEFAPAVALPQALRTEICNAAVKLMASVHYVNAATVEFLVEDGKYYFLEVNPRVQVEHTVTELITGIDIVQTQIKIAQGQDLYADIHLPKQNELTYNGAAIQCRVTTEDPANDFMPDTGTIVSSKLPGGNGVRLDVGSVFNGAVVTPYFDSLLAKTCVHAADLPTAARKMTRALNEFKIQGVKTNVPYLRNVMAHPTFQAGEANTHFIGDNPDLFNFKQPAHDPAKLVQYLADVTVNGFSGVPKRAEKYYPETTFTDDFAAIPAGVETAKDVLDRDGVDGVKAWLLHQDKVLLTDTTMRDAHQSLFATRMRTKDMLTVAEATQKALPQLFSYEMWGGATFDVAYRFLNEDPWARLKQLRKAMPRTLFQMLFRGSNAVGYQDYPDNVIQDFIAESAKNGIDVFRIFDSLNWLSQMEKSIEAVKYAGKIAEGTICYTGDILDASRQKYNLAYYKQLALDLQSAGSDMLAIKDMAGVLKPQAAYELVSTLKDALDIPVHLHTHDTTGNGVATYVAATKAGVDVVDVAANAFSGTTSQPSMGATYYALSGNDRQPDVDIDNVEKINRYWEGVRPYYTDFSNGVTGALTNIYQTQMPGGQYSNLQQQSKSLGLGDSWATVQKTYTAVNDMFGDIIKVTPSSKVVGDMALFMVQNKLTPQDVYDKGDTLDFPKSVIDFFAGDIGQPAGGFPEKLQKIVLKGRKPLTVRPGSLAKPADFEATATELAGKLKRTPTHLEVLSYLIYPQVFLDYEKRYTRYGDVSVLDTSSFFQGIREGETVTIETEPGKTLVVKLNTISAPDADNVRTLSFNVNGRLQEITIKDVTIKQAAAATSSKPKADAADVNQIGATLSGSVVKVLVKDGQKVQAGESLIVTEAMKMETTIQAPKAGTVKQVSATVGETIENGDLLVVLS